MASNHHHAVDAVRIEGFWVTVVCACGDEFGPAESEGEAMGDFDAHFADEQAKLLAAARKKAGNA